jgi:phosphinothricin acetyltransferase
MNNTEPSTQPKTSPPVQIRRPFLKDFPAILDISNWATCHTAANFRKEPDTLEHWVDLWKGKAERHPWLVAEFEGSIIGFAMASPFHGRCGMEHTAEVTVYVHPNHLSRGVGRALYDVLIPTLREQGFRTLVAMITVPNPASERLHEMFGFEKVGSLAHVGWKLGRWHDIAIWQHILDDGNGRPEPIRSSHEVRTSPTRTVGMQRNFNSADSQERSNTCC